MRVNVYAEEMTNRVEIVEKTIDGKTFTGLRLYLELPVTIVDPFHDDNVKQVRGPFIHSPGDDDSAAITFWGKTDLREVIGIMQDKLDEHYSNRVPR